MPYRIKLKKGNFELEVQGDKLWVESKFKELTTEEISIPGTRETMPRSTPETLGEFLDQNGNPQKHTEVVAVFAYWLFKVEKMELFNVKDIVECYNKTRRAKPSNPNQIINTNVASNLFAEAEEKKDGYKAWVITRTGEEYVEKMG
jgi:hypothetical protein